MLWFRQWTSIRFTSQRSQLRWQACAYCPFCVTGAFGCHSPRFFSFVSRQSDHAGLSGHRMTFELAAMVVRERALAGGFLRTFGDTIGNKVLVVACVAVAFMLPPGRAWSVPSRNCAIPLGALVFAVALLADSGGQMDALPSPYSVPAQLLVSQLSSASADEGRRSSVNYPGTPRPTIKKIVMVVDESVRGDYLGLNNRVRQYSGFDPRHRCTRQLRNRHLGCQLFRSGPLVPAGWLAEATSPRCNARLERDADHLQYARNANLKTILIDTWNRFGTFQSYMNTEEARQIDEFITLLDFHTMRVTRRQRTSSLKSCNVTSPCSST